MKFLYIDIMRDYIWPFYHKWILHKGRYRTKEWFKEWFFDNHHNPFRTLTPRLLKRQFERPKDIEL